MLLKSIAQTHHVHIYSLLKQALWNMNENHYAHFRVLLANSLVFTIHRVNKLWIIYDMWYEKWIWTWDTNWCENVWNILCFKKSKNDGKNICCFVMLMEVFVWMRTNGLSDVITCAYCHSWTTECWETARPPLHRWPQVSSQTADDQRVQLSEEELKRQKISAIVHTNTQY